MSENKHTPEPWRCITSPGQVKQGDKLHFTIGDETYVETAKAILFQGTDREEIIYNKRRNYYLITSMCMANQGSQKNVRFLSVETIDLVRKQRDELLAALTKLSGMKLNMIADGIVDKALASVKGGAA